MAKVNVHELHIPCGRFYTASENKSLVNKRCVESDLCSNCRTLQKVMTKPNFASDHQKLYRHYGFKEPDEPLMMEESLLKMRLNFLLEELIELAEACGYTIDFYYDSKSDGCKPKFMKNLNTEEYVVSPEGILDGLVDLLVVLMGTVYFFGFLKKYKGTNLTYFDDAWNRVLISNFKKEVGKRDKRGHQIDLKKPEGWKAPDLTDLVRTFFGRCRDCGNVILRRDETELDKCSACAIK